MKLERIDSIRVFGKTYKIVYTNSGVCDLLDGKFGKVSFQTQTMYIDDTLKGEQMMDAFFHEFFHIISSDLRMDLTENHIQQLACGITDFMINNSHKLIFTEGEK